MRFFLGTHKPQWLWDPRFTDVPLFVSARSLRGRRNLRPTVGPWALDSGGFTELSMHGEWRTSARDYVAQVRELAAETGTMAWAAPQDWMCEEPILKKTGRTIAEHRTLTVTNLLILRDLAPELPFIPVLQGYERDDYFRCAELYEARGIDLTKEPVVGVGTICRRQGTVEAEAILRELAGTGIKPHAFGAKLTGLARYHDVLASSDSLAWSFDARYTKPYRHPACREAHAKCNNCPTYALAWRERVLNLVNSAASAASEMPWT